MHITERQSGDLARLRKMARAKNAEQKDRLTAAALAVEGLDMLAIILAAGQEWHRH